MVNPTGDFNVFIPVTFSAGDHNKYMYVGYQKINPVTKKKYLAYVEPMRTLGINAGSTAAGLYGPDVATAFVGQSVPNMVLKANLAGAGVTTVPTAANSGNNLGGAFSYFSEWDYIRDSTVTGWSAYGTCHKMNYLYYFTNYALYLTGTAFSYSYKRMSGIVCPFDLVHTNLATAQLTISNAYLPAKWGKTIPGYGAYSNTNGQLLYLRGNTITIGQDLVINGTVTLPPAGPLLIRSVG